jgi:hypothetical protein
MAPDTCAPVQLVSRKIHVVGSSRKDIRSCRVVSRYVASQAREAIAPQRQLEAKELAKPKLKMPEVMSSELRTQYNALLQLTPGTQAHLYKDAKFDSYSNLIKKLIVNGHILGALPINTVSP